MDEFVTEGVALSPTLEELASAADWVAGQDAGDVFPALLRGILESLDVDLG